MLKEMIIKLREARFCYDDRGKLRTHLLAFIKAPNFACGLKTLSGLTPYEYIYEISTSEPEIFILNQIHQMQDWTPKNCMVRKEATD